MSAEQFWTPLGVRLRTLGGRRGAPNWLFLPDGPGFGSDSLVELVECLQLPGTSWLVDLPGDGSNTDAPGAPPNPYLVWPHVLLEAVAALAHPVCVGHGAGGHQLLSVPAIERHLTGMVLIGSAPDAGWIPQFRATAERFPLDDARNAAETYDLRPSDDRLRRLVVASAPWYFTAAGLPAGRSLLSRMPYNHRAADWSAAHFDLTYLAAWWPSRVPTLLISGAEDDVVDQSLWNDRYYQGRHIHHRTIQGAGHFPWIDRPALVRAAFGGFLPALGLVPDVLSDDDHLEVSAAERQMNHRLGGDERLRETATGQ
jgi:pimeloyl-ACP methyl ester carboxylesterase